MRLDAPTEKLWPWLSRNRMAPRAGSRPIGVYRVQCYEAERLLIKLFGSGATVRVRKGYVTDGETAVSTRAIYDEADRLARR
jgi:hypothetical protein